MSTFKVIICDTDEVIPALPGELVRLNPSDEALARYAKTEGWMEKIPDPEHQKKLQVLNRDLLQLQIDGAPDSEIQAVAIKMQGLQGQPPAEVDNPLTAKLAVITSVKKALLERLKDQTAMQEKVNAALADENAKQEAEAAALLGIDSE